MGFCRRCGDIVSGPRCKCGGTPVDPVSTQAFKRLATPSERQDTTDRWSKTYVSPPKSTSPVRMQPDGSSSSTAPSSPALNTPSGPSTSRRFPRPQSSQWSGQTTLKSGVSDHISTSTSKSPRPPSPLKTSTTYSSEDTDIMPSFLPHEPTLSKVYGSVLQPKDTLTLHSCAICTSVFPPDATIYPNLSSDASNSFLCRPCFISNGGTKGNCPACSRPVLVLKTEGAYIHSGNNYWHKSCYNCAGCFKNIGDAPMVDLLGRPSCVDCFDTCLKRDHPSTPKRGRTTSNSSPNPNASNPGGLNSSYGPGRMTRENSPALEELELRLGLMKTRDSSTGPPGSGRKQRISTPNSLNNSTSSKRDVLDSISTNRQDVFTSDVNTSSRGDLGSLRSRSKSMSQTEWTETATGPSDVRSSPKPHSLEPISSGAITVCCGACRKRISNPREGGQYITVPGSDENSSPQIFHSQCLRCAICDKLFGDTKKDVVGFTNCAAGVCHLECAPIAEPHTPTESLAKGIKTPPNTLPTWAPSIPKDLPMWTSNKPNNSMPPPALPTHGTQPSYPTKPFPRFGGQASCPGCRQPVSTMERGVVPGPQGSKWHAACLVCGGKKTLTRATLLGRSQDNKGEPGCGKKLDSAAKIDGDGGVWCRECLLLLGVGGSPLSSPTRSQTVPGFPGGHPRINTQITGTTTIARQFTGAGGNDSVLRQLTGGGLSPTRSISPTKQLSMFGSGNGGMRPRPKSVIGMRNTKSVDEGRGMYLVRQLTGATSTGGWAES